MKKDNAWNIKSLVDELIHPATKRIMLKVIGFYHLIKVPLDAEAAEKFLNGIY